MYKLSSIAKSFLGEVGKLSVSDAHRKAIALKTLRMNSAIGGMMGGMTREEAVEYLLSIGYTDQQIAKLAGYGKSGGYGKTNEASPTSDRETNIVSDIAETWSDPAEISQDVREYLMGIFNNQRNDYEIEDAINAIEQGIKEFRKITNV